MPATRDDSKPFLGGQVCLVPEERSCQPIGSSTSPGVPLVCSGSFRSVQRLSGSNRSPFKKSLAARRSSRRTFSRTRAKNSSRIHSSSESSGAARTFAQRLRSLSSILRRGTGMQGLQQRYNGAAIHLSSRFREGNSIQALPEERRESNK